MAAVPTGAPPGAQPRRRGPRRRLTGERVLFFALFLGLPLLIYGVFVVNPFVQAFYFSLTDWRGLGTPEFIGLENYVTLAQDPTFRLALVHNLVLAIVLPALTIGLAFTLAILVTIGGRSRGQIVGVRGSTVYRVVSFFPYVIPGVVTGILFAFIYNPNGGLLNGVLNLVLPGDPVVIAWLGSRTFAMPAIVIAVLWSVVGFYMVLFVAAIRAVPSEVLEAARIDGAGRLRIAVQVVLPIIRENISTALVYVGIMALDMFIFVNIMTPNGGTGKSTEVIGRYLYETAFVRSEFGLASAMGVVLALVTMLFAVLVLFGTNRRSDS